MRLKLPEVSLIAIAGSRQAETIAAIYKCTAQIEFAAVKLLTNINISATGIDCVNVGGLESWDAYNKFCVKELGKWFDTSHVLICQWDGYVLDAECWDDDFLNYDWIGAKWLDIGKPYNCGNGGFALKSRKLQTILESDERIITYCPEDVATCKVYGQYLIDKYDIRFCTEEIADKFSFELNQPVNKTFGFHGIHWQPYRETIMIKRSGALGDVIMLEPVLHYFHQKGFQVALDTQDEFSRVYFQHYFPVVPKSYLNPKTKYREIDLNMSYEIKPQQSVLQSFYEMAGITNAPLRNSRLNIQAGDNQKLFPKYAIIHIDETGMEYRNQYNIDWKKVILFLENNGYLVFQIGRRVDVQVAPFLNTMNLEFMMFIVKGADLFIGLDSGCAQVAVGFNIPSVIFFGSVNPKLRYSDFGRIRVVQSECPKEETKNCYHHSVDVVGSDCVYNKQLPPCTQYTSEQVIKAIKELI